MRPAIISGDHFQDPRGILYFNNDFNAFGIKRVYMLENADINLKRGWQGHRIEQRWFFAAMGSFTIKLVKVNNWEYPATDSKIEVFTLNAKNLDILHVPPGYASCIQALETSSRLVLFSDYALGEINDEYRYECGYFKEV